MVLHALNLSTLNAGILITNDATSKIDDVLTVHCGLLQVLPLAVHLVGGTILSGVCKLQPAMWWCASSYVQGVSEKTPVRV